MSTDECEQGVEGIVRGIPPSLAGSSQGHDLRTSTSRWVGSPRDPLWVTSTKRGAHGRYFLSTVCVSERYRGRGYCARFLSELVRYARYENRVVYLEVERVNSAAVRCYERAGFVLGRHLDERYDEYVRRPESQPTR